MADKSKLWTLSPVDVLRASASPRVEDIDFTATPGFDGGKSDGKALLEERGEVLAALQEKLYAHGRTGGSRSVLLVLQGMDTAGKGGMVKHVIGLVDPQGVDLASFGVPNQEEKQHHYLWRIRNALPRAGRIGVFDRSHYEDVLVVAVHDLVPRQVWEKRFDEINSFEKELVESGTVVVKVALFVSPEEQKKRLQERLDRPDKHWKYNPGDVTERGFLPQYRAAYQRVLDRTDLDHAPWFVIPADRKWYSRLAVTEILIDALEKLDLDWPAADFDVEHEKKRLAES
ncbi:PPK2 family polyphosphate--nucleotide phosphotransferase [Rhodococcoides fascians]|uniref:polyphosphate kinase 2 family protein n=1 Tax=Rhodococcoides fascians TaxID=1828 RepID=UPI000B9C17A0|nr:polyphosphate kinase 2 family protein [Rhodococcus fascians]OZE88619.1 PPK2 family polyphosphate--nucleotide phosphotransferase [Rhodococcus fascians]OZF16580.1 PPK2 family polyphosphate--nucleotide phosphotransferase [Rhodococcus fascians]OZF19596.1 PPK2 family polyphosphate--nucleotide phosphotransferase [Rhodococcus fascians]OZF65862.1 PPK2 family polyphosphate--nucleotide phosphotransferase [Rhodococcus fascians]OZF69013.1 PPK2 family polyphosphate--nucleotide phosphotransferase [Rhodoc